MYLSVQHAARRLGVSPHTVRRWTESGLLPCTRTAGGHRRIKQEDVDELAHLIGGRNHLTTRLERERELEVLTEAAESLAGPAAGAPALERLARCAAALLECSGVLVWALDEAGDRATQVAGHGSGKRRGAAGAFSAAPSLAARRALDDGEAVAVRADDPGADAADLALLRRDGDAALLVAPAVAGGETLGLLEVRDRQERTYTRQEVRLVAALATLTAVALADARLRDGSARVRAEQETLRVAVARVVAGRDDVRGATAHETLQAAARLATDALGGLACVASRGTETAGAVTMTAGGPPAGEAHVLVASAGDGEGRVVLTLTLAGPPAPGLAELLGMVAAFAGPSPESAPRAPRG